jgi:hypothetical protein
MAASRILVIAPELDMRQIAAVRPRGGGLCCDATAAHRLRRSASGSHFDVTVIDHRALAGPQHRAIEYCESRRPVILLSSRPIAWLSAHVAHHVEKPVAGDAVVAAVHSLLHDKPPRNH